MKLRHLFLLPFFTLPLFADPHSHHHDQHLRGIHAIDIAQQNPHHLHLLTADYDGHSAKPKLLHLHSSNGGKTWSNPVQVDRGQPHAHAARRGMDPQIAASDSHLVAVWMTPGTDPFGGGPLATAISSDNGKTWTPGPNPADDGRTDGHGFLDIAADQNGHFHLVWLDNRNDQRGLRYAKSTDHGKTWTTNQTLDAETCECCWNSIAIQDNQLAILYRDKHPRDMKLLISRDLGESWQPAQTLGKFDWNLDVCPHVGGALAIRDQQWHAAIWTAAAPKPGLYHLHSNDSGKTWSNPTFIHQPSSTHPSIAITSNGHLAISATHQTEDGQHIHSFLSKDQGKTWQAPRVISTANASASHPLTFASSDTFHLFWTETPAHQPTIWRTTTLSTP